MRQIILDVETTGLSADRGDKIIEIAMLEMIDNSLTGNIYHQYCNPEINISEKITDITGITNDFIKNYNKIDEHKISNFIQDDDIIAHNAKFDMSFLNKELGNTLSNKVIDTLAIAKSVFPKQKNSLDCLCDRFSIDKTKRSKHG